MIKIQKDNNVKVVTQGAYREFYEHLGYEIVNEKKPLKKEVEKKVETKTEDKKEDKVEIKKADKGKLEGYSRK